MVARLRRAAGEIAVEEAVPMLGGFLFGLAEDRLMHRRERAGRVGVGGVPGQREGLAAAAAEIDLPQLAALARLLHPAGTAIAVERLGVLPDPGDRMVRADRFELHPGDGLRRMARQDLADRRDVEE